MSMFALLCCLRHCDCLHSVSLQAQLRELQQTAEDLQIKLEEQRRRKDEADRLKEQALKALDTGESSKRLKTFDPM